MKISDVISVDPCRITEGAKHPELAARFLRKSRMMAKTATPSKRGFLNFLFASLAPGVNRHGVQMLLVRLCFSAIFIVSGSFILSGETVAPATGIEPYYFALAEIVVGSMLALGLFARVAMLVATAGFGFLAAEAIIAGVFDMTWLLCTCGSFAFLLMGVGKYSCDTLIRKSIIKAAMRRRRRLGARRMSYKAFLYS